MSSNWQLVRFRTEWADEVLSWSQSDAELLNWASLDHRPENSATFDDWHSDPEIRAFVVLCDDTPIAYGEIWSDAEANEVEFGRILVKPEYRRVGIGRRLIAALTTEAADLGRAAACVRVRPGNDVAVRCYESAGFQRVDPKTERRLNEPQPVDYLWYSCRFARE